MVNKKITNWGKFPSVEAQVYRADNIAKLQNQLTGSDSLLARGNGRCYGDAALNETIIDTLAMNRLIDFDPETGELECEAGALLSDLLEFIVPKGFFLPVTPGTKFISIGGALASDVHGKNHHIDGCFSDHVAHFHIMTDSGEVQKCSPSENPKLFWSTMGGMGLTGIILSARFRLKKIETAFIRQESLKAKNLDEIMDFFEQSENWTYTVAWIDCLQKGKSLGRSILMRGEHARVEEISQKQKKKALDVPQVAYKTIPFDFPSFVLNTMSVKAFNFLYYNKQFSKVAKSIISYDTFFYPLDAVHEWNRIYGKNGFIQYQFVIPKESGKKGMQIILQTISESGQGSFLAVLKLFGKNNPLAYNSFPIEGYTLALDFKRTAQLPKLVAELDVLVERFGGRIYRAKDSMSKASLTDYLQNTESTRFDSVQNKRIKQQSC